MKCGVALKLKKKQKGVEEEEEQEEEKITVDERVNSLGSCSALNSNQCWLSQVTIPDTTWTTANPLLITLERHSSIIKNGSKLSNYVIAYSTTGAAPFHDVPYCSPTVLPALGAPCINVCVEIALATNPKAFVWSCTIKALDNGGYGIR